MKGILRKPITETKIGKGTKLTIDFGDIFGIKGDWKIDIRLDENITMRKENSLKLLEDQSIEFNLNS